jgi:hypothetical protein
MSPNQSVRCHLHCRLDPSDDLRGTGWCLSVLMALPIWDLPAGAVEPAATSYRWYRRLGFGFVGQGVDH